MNRWIRIGERAFPAPVAEMVGTDGPLFVLVCGVHGDELDPIVGVDFLLREARDHPPPGICRVIPFANPVAVLEGTRTASVGPGDLNRAFDKALDGYLQAVADSLMRATDGAALVVTLHQFETPCPLTAAYYSTGNDVTRARQRTALQALDPEVIVWADPDADPDYVGYSGSLDAVLNRRGVPCVMLETSRRLMEDASQSTRLGRGLVSAWRALTAEPQPRALGVPVVRRRHHVRPTSPGLFRPVGDLQLMSSVAADQHLGEFISVPDFEQTCLLSPAEGLLLQLRQSAFVRASDYVAVIGEPVPEATVPWGRSA